MIEILLTILGFLLTILKILGIIVLCVLGLIVGILLIVFLVPIRYQAQGELYEEYDIKVKVHWLLHLLHVVVQLRGKMIEVSVKVLGIPLFSMKKEPEQEDMKEQKDSQESETKEKENLPEESVEHTEGQSDSPKQEELSQETPEESEKDNVRSEETILAEETSEDKVLEETASQETVVEDDRTFSEKLEDKINACVDAITDKIEHLEESIENLQDKIEKLKKTLYHYTDLISHEKTQNLLKRLFKEIGGIFVHIAPKKLKANLHVGMDNPATTGQICMYAAMLYPIYKNNIQLEPDFEEKILEGTFSFKGRIRLGHFVAMLIRLVVNKDFLYVITHIKPKEKKIKKVNERKSSVEKR